MKKVVFLSILIAFVGITAIGCTGTVKGVKHDIGNAYDATKETVREIGK
jgi:predicted small secreted protein